MAVQTGYNPTLVALSIAIAIFAAYTALDLGSRVRGAAPGQRVTWVVGAALAMGGGIWAMHFVGMLAFAMAMPVTYELVPTVASFLIAVGATGAAFAWVSRPGAGTRSVLVSGPLMGVGVAAMHYTGMAAMRMPGNLAFSAPIVAASVAIAVIAATAALWLTFRQNEVWQKLAAAAVMGLAVAGMHYTGMAAATFTADDSAGSMGAHGGHVSLGQQNLALYVAGATFLILFLAMLASSIDQQRTRRALLESEERFRAAAEAVGDIIWTNNAEGEMRGPQPDWQRFTGQSQDACQGRGWGEAIHPDDIAETLLAWNTAVAQCRTAIFEHRVRRHDGVYRLFAVRAVPVLNPNRSIREWVGVHEDITERRDFELALKSARDAAENANRAKSTFLANMSHELRTPLSAIIGYSEMLLEDSEDGSGAGADALAGDLEKIRGNARHLLGLINDVLDLSKIESGKMEVFAERFAIRPMLDDIAATVEPLMAAKGNRLEMRLAPGLGEMVSDLTKVRQILLNLLGNAAKFTTAGIVRLIMTSGEDARGARVVFTVTDTGIGMSAAQVAQLFQRFHQADASTTRKFGGSGLGLSLTRAFTDMLGGTVEVASVPDRGSSFTVSLPMTYVAPAEALPQEVTDVAHASGDVVLVIDDDADQRALMTRFLQREGFGVRTAADGEAGLAVARATRPHAILLDVVMPGLDGWSVLSTLKGDPDLSAIPVVMVSFAEQRPLALSLGAADYVAKPVSWEGFRPVMERYRRSTGEVASAQARVRRAALSGVAVPPSSV